MLSKRNTLDLNDNGLFTTPSGRDIEDLYTALKIDTLFVKDIPTLEELIKRSPHFERLLHLIEGQPVEENWLYFLASPQVVEQWKPV